MQPSECCIIRASIAAVLGAVATFALALDHGLLVSILLSPVIGSTVATGAVVLFWFVSLFIPCASDAERIAEASR